MCNSNYYVRNVAEKEFDDMIRSSVYHDGDKAQMALYLQNQTILNMLRHLDDVINKKHKIK